MRQKPFPFSLRKTEISTSAWTNLKKGNLPKEDRSGHVTTQRTVQEKREKKEGIGF
jgi:hypothetical protein